MEIFDISVAREGYLGPKGLSRRGGNGFPRDIIDMGISRSYNEYCIHTEIKHLGLQSHFEYKSLLKNYAAKLIH